MTRVIDLDQLRSEANAETVEVRVQGHTFELPTIMPVALSLKVETLARTGDGQLDAETASSVFTTIVTGLVGDRADELMTLISLEELQNIIVTAYGMTVGESSASVASSQNGGTQLRPTSRASTVES